uniref:Uncharacterized protein n=1 Tax=Arundo donax TaxID=35708 RepID=A0A0A9G641_ARUDO
MRTRFCSSIHSSIWDVYPARRHRTRSSTMTPVLK